MSILPTVAHQRKKYGLEVDVMNPIKTEGYGKDFSCILSVERIIFTPRYRSMMPPKR
jgi:hypothetical protein